ncbi:MAG: TetR/AcrR family transcriptional regulator [Limnobacter sp.]|nr:TetR/AcrR family transcriptional regulator [Limnobacter sp.]
MSTETIERIFASAEAQARAGGYNAFSFREIAKDIGIKSASIHYHFPTKEDLAIALAHRYTRRFQEQLEQIPIELDATASIKRYVDLFRASLTIDKKMCLCAVWAAEVDDLPHGVRKATQAFFNMNLAWLAARLEKIPDSKWNAAHVLATLEGSMLLAKTFDSIELFDRSTAVFS